MAPDQQATLDQPTADRAAVPVNPGALPLFVDLDGTLLATDLTQEAILLAVKEDPLVLFRLPGWLRQGLAPFKAKLAERVTPAASDLPAHDEVLVELARQKALGRPLILATASDRRWAEALAARWPLFDQILASDGVTNLKSANKLAAIEALCRERGWSGFEYWGDSRADLAIWQGSLSRAILAVNPPPRVRAALRANPRPQRVIKTGPNRLWAVWKALRPQQWIKNLLLFVPLLLAHQWGEGQKILWGIAAFVAFSLCASAVYVFNDLVDAPADRRHPIKCARPFAAGALPLLWGPVLAVGLLTLGCAIALFFLPWSGGTALKFTAVLLVYLVLNLCYTLWLKRHMVIDVMVLAGMYCLRVYIGGIATQVDVSEWLMAFAIFFFTSLAFAKRYAELARHADEDATAPAGRGYGVDDLGIIESVGPTSGYMAVLVLALYVNSPSMKVLYKNPLAMWLICPLMLYWLTRLWFVAKRRALDEDPLVFAIHDRISLLIGALIVILVICATVIPPLNL